MTLRIDKPYAPKNAGAGLLSFYHDRSGVVAVIVALLLAVFLGFAALAIDIGHIMVVRNELQNAADAAALAGASYLYPQTPPASPQPPSWATATAQATGAIGLNQSDGVTLSSCVVQAGYWNFARTPAGLQGQGITPGPQDFPAVQVTVTKSAGLNGGAVQHWFAPVIGINTSNVSATATAIMASPGTALAGALLPIAISQAMANQAATYNSAANQVYIGSSYHYAGSQAGQWTSFATNASDSSTMTSLLGNGNPTQLSVGQNIWIEPATKAAIYSSVPVGVNVLLAIVGNVNAQASVPIIGFVGFHITASVGGSSKYIKGYFLPAFYAGSTGDAGPNYGAYSPPSLVQ
jgi:Flp pilus assembly protein TadG